MSDVTDCTQGLWLQSRHHNLVCSTCDEGCSSTVQCHEPILLIKLLPSILAFVSTGIVASKLAAAMAMPAQPSSLLPVHPWSKDPDTSPKAIPLP